MVRVAGPEKVLDELNHILLITIRDLTTVALEDRPQQDMLDGLGHATRTTAATATVASTSRAAIPSTGHPFAVLPFSSPLLLLLLRHRLNAARSVVVVSVHAAVLRLCILWRLSLRRLITATQRGRCHEHRRRGHPQAVAVVHLRVVAQGRIQTGRGGGCG